MCFRQYACLSTLGRMGILAPIKNMNNNNYNNNNTNNVLLQVRISNFLFYKLYLYLLIKEIKNVGSR